MFRKKGYYIFCFLVLPAAMLFTSLTLYAQSYLIKPIVTLLDEITPGSELFVRYINTSGGLSINNNGDLVFRVSLSDSSTAIMLFANNELKFLIKSKGLASDSDEFVEVDSPVINDKGTVAFFGVSALNHDFDTKIFKHKGGNIVPIVVPGDSVNGLDTTINSLCCSQSMSINNNGEVAFVANLEDGRYGIFVYTENEIKPIIVFGGISDTPVTVEGNEVLRLFGNVSRINDKGEIAFGAELSRGLGLLFIRNGEIVSVLIPGAEAPGTNGNIFREGIIGFSLNNNSNIVFSADVGTLGGNPDNPLDRQGSGVFLWNDGVTQPLILTGDDLPEIEGESFERSSTLSFLTKNSINDFEETAISLSSGDQNIGIFVLSKDDIFPAVLTEDIQQGLGNLIQPSFAAINNRGDIIFEGIPNPDKYGLRSRAQSGLFMAIKEE